jgi:hypothetical protein
MQRDEDMKPILPPVRSGDRRWRKVPDSIKAMILKEHSSITYAELSAKYNLAPSVLWYIRKGIPCPNHRKK